MSFDAEACLEGGGRNPVLVHDGRRAGYISFISAGHFGNSPYRSPPHRILKLQGHFDGCEVSPFGEEGLDGNGERCVGQRGYGAAVHEPRALAMGHAERHGKDCPAIGGLVDVHPEVGFERGQGNPLRQVKGKGGVFDDRQRVTGFVHGIRGFPCLKRVPVWRIPFLNGGVDGARTRDFQRDRLAL
jgi:hypothetical protein